MDNEILIEQRKQSFLEKYITHPNERYRAYINTGNDKEASFYGKTAQEAIEKALYYQKHYLNFTAP